MPPFSNSDSPARVIPSPTEISPLLVWLLQALQPMNRTRVKQLLQQGCVHINGTPITQHNHAVQPSDRITISRVGTAKPQRTSTDFVPIVFQDDAIVLIDKPTGLLTVATEAERIDTAFVRLKVQMEAERTGRPFVVHRLDRETSGLLLFAKSPTVRDTLQTNWETIAKTYLAIVEGEPKQREGVIESFLTEGQNLRVRVSRDGPGAKWAVTRYKLLAKQGRFSLLQVVLETGRKHQIRVHLASIGCPVIGDVTYGATTNPARRLGLHAWKLAFHHPISGNRIAFEADFPAVLSAIVPNVKQQP